jgi:DNA-binding NarL/FixJ family response regulator
LIRVLLVAHSPALLAGLRSLLSKDDEIKIIGEQNESSDSLQDVQSEADVVITTSASLNAYREIDLDNRSSPAILFLQDEPIDFRSIKPKLPVWGILPSDSSANELCAAVHALSQGLIVGAQQLLFRSLDDEAPNRGPLSERESEVLSLLAKGLANKQIAITLGISEHTVKFHVSSIYTKLNAANRTQAVREGLRNGWIVL